MLDTYTILDAIAKAVAGYATLSTWSNTIYGNGVTVSINYQKAEPPGDSDCPYCVVYPIAEEKGQNRRERIFTVALLLDIYDTEVDTRSEANITEYKGTERLKIFYQYCLTAIKAISALREAQIAVYTEFDVTSMYPLHEAAVRLDITETWAMGDNPLS